MKFLSFLGIPVNRRSNTVKEKVENRNFQFLARMLISFLVRLVAFICSFPFEFWRRQSNIYPSNVMEDNQNSCSGADETVYKEDPILPCIQRLQSIEKKFEELRNKPAEIPFEKEQILLESLDRIKSVEFDLEKTKRVSLVLTV